MLKVELSYRGLLTIIGAVFGVWVVWHLWPVLLLLLISLILMIGLLPYVEAMVRWGLPRPLAVVLIRRQHPRRDRGAAWRPCTGHAGGVSQRPRQPAGIGA